MAKFLSGHQINFTYPQLYKQLITNLLIIMKSWKQDSGEIIYPSAGVKFAYLAQAIDETEVNQSFWGYITHTVRNLIEIREQLSDLEQKMESCQKDEIDKYLVDYGKLQVEFESSDAYNLEHTIDTVLSGLKINDIAPQTPLSKLSSGQRSRAGLARILLTPADLMILDEPTNHLDIRAQKAIEKGLKTYRSAVIYVSHDRKFIQNIGGKILEIKDGKAMFLLHGIE